MPIEPLQPAPVPPAAPPVAPAAPASLAPEAPPRPEDASGEERWERALDAVRTAAEAYEQLRAHGRSLHFEIDRGGLVRIEVYDAAGELVRRIPPTEALALAAGETTWLA